MCLRHLIAPILAFPVVAQAPLSEALSKGKVSLEVRTRYEHVEDADVRPPTDQKTANALTNRTLLGFETGALWGMKGTLQFAHVTALGEERYHSGVNAKSHYATVQDPGNTEVLQAFVAWKGLKLGRQVLRVDNQRFIGPGAWSQMPKAFRGMTYQTTFGVDWVDLYAGHLNQITTSLSQTRPLKADFVRARFMPTKAIAITPFWFGLEETTRLYGAAPEGSVQHLGLRADGRWKDILYDGSYARQRSYKDATRTANRLYFALTGGYAFSKELSLKATHEVLQGASRLDAIQNAFTTPLASLHGFYGWSDRLGATPVMGLVDDFLQVEAKVSAWAVELQVHRFRPEQRDRGFIKYGNEADLSVAWNVTKQVELMFKAADYRGETGALAPYHKDLRKVWLMSTYKF